MVTNRDGIRLCKEIAYSVSRIKVLDIPLYNHRIGRLGSITSESDIKKHQDYMDMHKVRIEDLLDWGYDSYARELAFSILLKYGTQEVFFANVVRQAKAKMQVGWKQRIMLFAFRLSPNIFDSICSITGKRVSVM